MAAMDPTATAAIGMIQLGKVPLYMEGSHFRSTLKNIIIISASQKLGIAAPTMVKNTITLSIHVFCFTAAKIPSGVAMIWLTKMAKKATVIVLGKRCINSTATGCFVL